MLPSCDLPLAHIGIACIGHYAPAKFRRWDCLNANCQLGVLPDKIDGLVQIDNVLDLELTHAGGDETCSSSGIWSAFLRCPCQASDCSSYHLFLFRGGCILGIGRSSCGQFHRTQTFRHNELPEVEAVPKLLHLKEVLISNAEEVVYLHHQPELTILALEAPPAPYSIAGVHIETVLSSGFSASVHLPARTPQGSQ